MPRSQSGDGKTYGVVVRDPVLPVYSPALISLEFSDRPV
jgi:hypothetical protein